jgi:hypothetical protein
MKIERDEIDENDWVQIQPLSKKRCKTSWTLEEMKECHLKRISIANWQYSSIHDRSLALDPERSSNKDRLQTAISEWKWM